MLRAAKPRVSSRPAASAAPDRRVSDPRPRDVDETLRHEASPRRELVAESDHDHDHQGKSPREEKSPAIACANGEDKAEAPEGWGQGRLIFEEFPREIPDARESARRGVDVEDVKARGSEATPPQDPAEDGERGEKGEAPLPGDSYEDGKEEPGFVSTQTGGAHGDHGGQASASGGEEEGPGDESVSHRFLVRHDRVMNEQGVGSEEECSEDGGAGAGGDSEERGHARGESRSEDAEGETRRNGVVAQSLPQHHDELGERKLVAENKGIGMREPGRGVASVDGREDQDKGDPHRRGEPEGARDKAAALLIERLPGGAARHERMLCFSLCVLHAIARCPRS
jgi:hypothetical protein